MKREGWKDFVSDEQLFREFLRRTNIPFDELDDSDGIQRVAISTKCYGCGENECIVFGFENGKFAHCV